MAKKKKELQPEIKDIVPNQEKQENIFLKSTFETLESKDKLFSDSLDENNEDSYFKAIVNKLMSEDNPSTKTEYLTVTENFVGAKLTFLSKYGNIPYLKDFVDTFETKRISLERKGRKELIMSLIERQQEIERQREVKMKSMFMGV